MERFLGWAVKAPARSIFLCIPRYTPPSLLRALVALLAMCKNQGALVVERLLEYAPHNLLEVLQAPHKQHPVAIISKSWKALSFADSQQRR